ncbi:MAG: ABC transporter ATP-binding protein [Calditrichaeota bacterium]|nr:ABC transporter ATP-binding protein [Calditrichota bacterium]
MNPIEVQNFYKRYGAVEAVRGISFSVKTGELFGLIGPDGAGKTTLLRTLCTLLQPEAGTVRVGGWDASRDIREIRKRLGYMPQQFSLYPDLTVQQNLQFFAELFQVPKKERVQRLEKLYHFSKLEPFKNRRAADLSGGMKQKLALSCALIHTPEILILDEPTFGVDPVSRQEFWEILREIRHEGTTILVSTAYMDEAEQCDRVALIFNGSLLGKGTPQQLKAEYPYPLFQVKGKHLRDLQAYFQSQSLVQTIQMFGDTLHVSFLSPPTPEAWQTWQKQSGGNLQDWQAISPTVEDVFLHLIGRSDE